MVVPFVRVSIIFRAKLYNEGNPPMTDTTIVSIDKSLEKLLQAEKDYPGYTLDLCTGYISTSGIILIKRMLQTAPKARAVVGLNMGNKVSAFQMLYHDCGIELYVYATGYNTLFHPKIYFGTRETQVWAMVGSSNLTKNGLSQNVEQNIFITGQRHTEPFISLEAQIAAYYKQAYLFDQHIEKTLLEIERKLGSNPKDYDYKRLLVAYGIKPKASTERTIPDEAQQIALNTLYDFAEHTKLEYAYQMLLLLFMLDNIDQNGQFSLEETAHYFANFYRARREAGFPAEKRYRSKLAVVDKLHVSMAQIIRMLKESPFPRFERQGLLDISEDEQFFIVNPALVGALTSEVKRDLQALGQARIAAHFTPTPPAP